MNEMIETVTTATNADPLNAFDLSITNDTPTVSVQTDNISTALPADYLDQGLMESDGKHRFLHRDYVDHFAKELAVSLTTGTPALTASAFRSAFLRDAKKQLRRSVPDGAKLTAVATMQVQATKLVSQNKAPSILIDMFAKIVPAVTDAETFQALYTHLDSIYTYMLQNKQQNSTACS